MDRRTFLQTLGMLGAAALLPSYSTASQSRYKLGLQLYSVNQEMIDNPAGTLATLVAMGYRDFETAIFGYVPTSTNPSRNWKKR